MSELANAVEKIARARTGEEVADIVRTAARLLSGADGVAVVLKEGDRVRYVDEDAVGPLWKGCDFPIEACISGWAILHDQTVIIEDVYVDPRIPLEVYRPTFVRSCVMTPVGGVIRSAASAPTGPRYGVPANRNWPPWIPSPGRRRSRWRT